MNIELIAIGDELLNGLIADKNARWLAEFLFKKGILLKKITMLRDEEEILKETFKKTFENNDFTIVTGGLGPTQDDVTKAILGEVFGGPQEENKKAIELVGQQYLKLNREWNRESNCYHMIPSGIEPVKNPIGLAPGLHFQQNGKHILCAPGVPREFYGMFEEEIYPLIQSHTNFPKKSLKQVMVRTKGVPEEEIFYTKCPNLWKDLSQYGQVASLPQLLGIDILVKFYVKDENEFIEKEKAIREIINESKIAENVWSWDESPLEDLIIKEANEKGLTISLAESCTGGMSSDRLTNVSGASKSFLASFVTYSNDIKIKTLNVKKETLEKFGAVSLECAKEMAAGARNFSGSDVAISYTGIAGPTGGSAEKPVGTVAIGWATKNENSSKIYNFKGSRELLKTRFSEAGLLILHELLRDIT
ncbi:CinA family nicotinamide mononucleotide deamidase-related protein [Bacteriovoracaceae bacterium]|nr:CinA family nicotinamide mononucleotide deamidase-related protein [Bacteriovoracaceae bacterium]